MNGRVVSGEDAKYADGETRGDVIGWFDPEEWHHGKGLESYLVKFLGEANFMAAAEMWRVAKKKNKKMTKQFTTHLFKVFCKMAPGILG